MVCTWYPTKWLRNQNRTENNELSDGQDSGWTIYIFSKPIKYHSRWGFISAKGQLRAIYPSHTKPVRPMSVPFDKLRTGFGVIVGIARIYKVRVAKPPSLYLCAGVPSQANRTHEHKNAPVFVVKSLMHKRVLSKLANIVLAPWCVGALVWS